MPDLIEMALGALGIGGSAHNPLGAPDSRKLAISEAERINGFIADGHTVHFQKSAVFPWRRIAQATPVGSMIRFDFADGSFRLCRCWSDAVDAGQGYALGFNLKLAEVA